ncbi:MAG: lytic murein transglycosylase [Gordonia sp. (in: high G+C Gram-positive bacteria)]|uniref:lytic transglycosylase domain-containing protein n=1 Tax=Gordonia sp. (in: high G+C Gram-positive bacteria) TaxID=84139 RepID=UPI0039E59239
MGIGFRRGPRRSDGVVPWRGIALTTGVTAVGAAMLVGTTSSTSLAASGSQDPSVSNEATVLTAEQAAVIAQSVPASVTTLQGFAPPANGTSLDGLDPQFRIAADLPSGPLGIPGVVLQAYKLAATRVATDDPQCKLPWYLLAGIGRIESGHAGDGNVDDTGETRTPIRGPVLDGSLAGNEVIHDTDGGALDGDPAHDRAMGPMQFIPSTWKTWGADGNGDGKADPDNIFDATYTAGKYLCSGVTDIMSGQNKVAAVLRYNHSMAYVNNVLGWAAAYATGTVPTGGIPEMADSPADNNGSKTTAKKKDDKKTPKPGETTPADPSGAPQSTAPSKTKQPGQCLGTLCLPDGVLPTAPSPQQKKAPQQSPQKQPTVKTTPR